MNRAPDNPDQVQQVLDRLGITSHQLFDFHHSIADRVASTPEWIDPNLHRRPPLGAGLRNWHINPDALDQRLRTLLDPLGIGFCYMLNRRGRLLLQNRGGAARVGTPAISFGPLQIPAVPGIDWDYDVPCNIASVSKFITAIATVMLLRDQGIDPATPVAGFLPQYWDQHWSSDDVTFHDLLRHESGFGWILNAGDSGPGDFTGARVQLEWGSAGSGLGNFEYKNCNFTILRATFPIVGGVLDRTVSLPGLNDTIWHAVSATVYRNFVNERIFAAAGIGPFDFKATPNAARAYGRPPTPPGAQLADVTTDAGSSGWHLSLADLMRVVAEFRHGGSMMSPGQAQQLLAARYGLDWPIEDTNAGALYKKRGRFNDGGNNTLDTAIYIMPDEMELGIFINSGPGSGVAQGSYNDTIAQLIANSAEAS